MDRPTLPERRHRLPAVRLAGMLLLLAPLAMIAVVVGTAAAQDDADAANEAPPEVTLDKAPEPGSSDEVMDDLLRQRRDAPPATAPQRAPERRDVSERLGVPAPTLEIDPAVLGIAPGESAPELRREGEFIVTRRGRLVRSTDGAHALFVFDADAKASPERPMIMMPCRMLESMEAIAADRRDAVEFVVSGEVFVYRKHNYLLPTAMRVAVDRGNLRN